MKNIILTLLGAALIGATSTLAQAQENPNAAIDVESSRIIQAFTQRDNVTLDEKAQAEIHEAVDALLKPAPGETAFKKVNFFFDQDYNDYICVIGEAAYASVSGEYGRCYGLESSRKISLKAVSGGFTPIALNVNVMAMRVYYGPGQHNLTGIYLGPQGGLSFIGGVRGFVLIDALTQNKITAYGLTVGYSLEALASGVRVKELSND